MTIQGIDTLILFDPMSHSRQSYVHLVASLSSMNWILIRDSGIGDHGPDGINTFTSQHMCNHICQALKLVAILEKDLQHDSETEEGEVEDQ